MCPQICNKVRSLSQQIQFAHQMNRQSWNLEEDQAISKLVNEFGFNDWTLIASKLKQTYNITKRTGKQCRERWYNHLNPAVNKKPWTNDEEEKLFELHKLHGNRWKDISRYFTGRTDNDIKNHFYSTLRRSLRRLNKILGQKNSTSQMREIKPSVLSTIMNYLYEQEHGLEKELYRSLRDLPSLIFEFANFKPIKTNLKYSKVEDAKIKISDIFQLINRFNQQYEHNKSIRHSNKQLKRSNSRKETSQILPTAHTFSSEISIGFQFKEQVEQIKNQQVQVKVTSVSQHQESESFQPDDMLNQIGPEPLNLKQEEDLPQPLQKEEEELPMYQSRNMSLEHDQLQFQQMQDPQQPSMVSRCEQGIQLMIVGRHWQPQSWEVSAEVKGFVDEVLQMNYEEKVAI